MTARIVPAVQCPTGGVQRRSFLGMLAVGLAAVLTGCETGLSGEAGAELGPPPPLPPIPKPQPGQPVTLDHGPPGAATARQVAITIDDGYCEGCVAGYAAFAARTGTHLTFSPNGTYAHAWAPQAGTLRPLIARGQVQIQNHTFSHRDLRQLGDAGIREELERNDEWITSTFGITSRPYYRPPFGFHTTRVDDVAGQVGYTRVTMWNGSYGDSTAISPATLMRLAGRYLQPGVILIGHANHPTVLGLFDEIAELIRTRRLTPVTLDEMFGTSRATGRGGPVPPVRPKWGLGSA